MANLSSVITQTVGTSVAGVNLVTAPNESSPWTVSTITKSTTTTAAELPLGPAIPTATKFTLAASSGTAYIDVDCPQALTNWCLQLGWFARCSAGFTAAISIASIKSYASTGNRTSDTSGTTITPRNSTIQGTAVSFQTTFDSNSQLYYRITLSFAAQVGAWYSIAQVEVGPGSTEQVPSMGAVTLNPSVIGATNSLVYTNTTITNCVGFQVGSWLEITGKLSFTGLPATGTGALVVRVSTSGLTIDPARSQNWSGDGVFYDASASGAIYNLSPVPYMTSNNLDIQFTISGDTASTAGLIPGSVPVAFANGDLLTFGVRIPISEWSGTVGTGRAPDEEYAYNTDVSTTASVTASGFASGALGIAFSASWTTNTEWTRTVQWQSPIQDGDAFEFQVYNVGTWMSFSDYLGSYSRQSAKEYGPRINHRSATQTDVIFCAGGFRNTGASYAADGAVWSGLSALKWRLYKYKKASLPFAKADSVSSGLVAPRKGQTTLTFSGTPAGWSLLRANGLYYQDQDGNHRLKFDICATMTSISSATTTIVGVTFKNVAGFNQPVRAMTASTMAINCYTGVNNGNISLDTASSQVNFKVSGDCELESKPSWA